MYFKAGIPALRMRRVENKLEALHKDLKNNLKKIGESKLQANSDSKKKLSCHCNDFSESIYPRDLKVPVQE